MVIRKMHQVMLPATDLERSVTFYREHSSARD
jgi:hypothetical protein